MHDWPDMGPMASTYQQQEPEPIASMSGCSGDLLTPSPPAEKTTAATSLTFTEFPRQLAHSVHFLDKARRAGTLH